MDTLTNPNQPYGCDWDEHCTATFSTRDELDAHEREHEATDVDFTCDDCGEEFASEQALDGHGNEGCWARAEKE